MSAYIVDKAHINALLRFADAPAYHSHSSFTWYHNEEWHELTHETEDAVGQMLLDENVKSVCYRYPDDSITSLPGRTDAEYLMPFKAYPTVNRPTATDALSMIGCYEYQSCEHPEWPESEAKAFCDALTHRAIRRLPGYEDAIRDWMPKHDGGTCSRSLILGR